MFESLDSLLYGHDKKSCQKGVTASEIDDEVMVRGSKSHAIAFYPYFEHLNSMLFEGKCCTFSDKNQKTVYGNGDIKGILAQF